MGNIPGRIADADAAAVLYASIIFNVYILWTALSFRRIRALCNTFSAKLGMTYHFRIGYATYEFSPRLVWSVRVWHNFAYDNCSFQFFIRNLFNTFRYVTLKLISCLISVRDISIWN